MDGAPFGTLREFVRKALAGLRGSDRFDLIRFGGSIDAFEEASVPATRENVARAEAWIDACRVGGGTEMLPAVRRFAAMPIDPSYRRIVGFLTDGFVGNEDAILAAIRADRGDARWFAFGVGSSVNRAFVEGVAAEGRGRCDVVLPGDVGAADVAARRFFDRLATSLLHDVTVDANGLPVVDVSPEHPPDLFDGEPIFVVGRYTAPCEGDLFFRGTAGGRQVTIPCHVVLPEIAPAREELASMWARARIAEWTSTALGASTDVQSDCATKITATAIEHHLVSPTTSFVCVDEDSFTAGETVTVQVASEVPQDAK